MKSWWIILIMALIPVGVVVVSQLGGMSAGSAPPEVVVADSIESFDPQIKAYVKDYIRSVKAGPSDVNRHVTLGQVYFANGHWRDARASFDNVITMAPDNAMAMLYGAICSSKLGEVDDANRRLADTVETDPKLAPAHFRIGALALQRGESKEAAASFQTAIDLAPTEPAGYIGLADVMIRRQEYARAVGLLEKAFELNARDNTAYYLLGLAYRGLGKSEEARQALAKGMSAQRRFMPDDWAPQINQHRKGVAFQLRRAQGLLKAQRSSEAIEALETTLRWHPDNVEVLNNLAIALMADMQHEKARDFLLQAESLGGNAVATYINLAACDIELGDFAQAEAYADKAIELGPGVAQAFATKANLLMRQTRWTEAAKALEQAVRLDDNNAAAQFDLGNMYMRLGRVHDARAAYAASAERDPKMLMAQVRTCEISLMVGAREEAEVALEKARRIAPNHRMVVALTERMEQNP